MLIANVNHQGYARTALAHSDGTLLDFTTALQLWDLARGSRFPQAVTSIQELLDSGRFDEALLANVVQYVVSHQLAACFLPADECRFLAPFARPGQIIALARNYSAHARESTLPVPHEPIFFSKANTSVIGPGDAIILPPNLGRIEPEIELAFVIRREAWHVPADEAESYIAGYTILNDVSAQELQAREIRESYPLFRCKSLKTFTPMGPWLATVREIGMRPELNMTLRVNGEPRVVTNTRGLTFGIARLLEFISGYIVLCPGDVVTTGCPKAAGAINSGDVVSLEIEKIGLLSNPVVAGKDPCPA